MNTGDKDEGHDSTLVLDIGVVVYVAFFLSVFSSLYLPVRLWRSLPNRVLRWPLGSLVYGHVNPYQMNDEQSNAFLVAYVFFVFCKAVLLLLPFVWVVRKSLHRYWWQIVAWVACLCPFLLGADVCLTLVQIEHRWTPARAMVLMCGVANVYVLKVLASLPTSRAKRVLYSLPCWLFWLLWFHIVTGDRLLKLVPLLGIILYGVALRKYYATSAAISTAQ